MKTMILGITAITGVVFAAIAYIFIKMQRIKMSRGLL